MYTREQTITINVGSIPVGGGYPVVIESMTSTDTRDAAATKRQIKALAEAGCEIIRVAVPDMIAAKAFKEIKKASPIPVIADIHFDYRLALAAIEAGADMIRLNPGNIAGGSDDSGKDRVSQVAEAAKEAKIPIRIGVNGGSLEKALLEKYGGLTPEALCESVIGHVGMLESNDFCNIAIAIKTSNVPLTLAANRLLCEKLNYPLHIGITEAGTPYRGTIKSVAGIASLLAMGIGDTIRVSLTGDPVEEIKVAKEILQVMNLRRFGPEIISCPTCGRCEADLFEMAEKVEAFCDTLRQPITVAVMGCIVNGPGEAREADFGIACGKGYGVIFQKGEIIERRPSDQLAEALITKIAAFCPDTKIS